MLPLRVGLARPAVILGCAVLAGMIALYAYLGFASGGLFDLEVYRVGARTWLAGGDLYGRLWIDFIGITLPFTYPPVAAVLFAPLGWLSRTAASYVMTGASAGLLAITLNCVLASMGCLRQRRALRWLSISVLLVVSLALDPVTMTLERGQINLILMGLVAADCLSSRPRWPRGLLVGLTAAVKLTPLVFLLFILAKKDVRSARTAGVSFLAATALGLVLAPGASLRYWVSLVTQPDRAGELFSAENQSLRGLLARTGLGAHWQLTLWIVGCATVLALTCVGLPRILDSLGDAAALATVAVAGLVVSPVSWTHHWVWAAPALLVLVVLGRRGLGWPAYGAAAVTGAVFVLAPQYRMPHGPLDALHWSVGQQLVGAGFVLIATAWLVAVAAYGRLGLTRGQVPTAQRTGLSRHLSGCEPDDGPDSGGPGAGTVARTRQRCRAVGRRRRVGIRTVVRATFRGGLEPCLPADRLVGAGRGSDVDDVHDRLAQAWRGHPGP